MAASVARSAKKNESEKAYQTKRQQQWRQHVTAYRGMAAAAA